MFKKKEERTNPYMMNPGHNQYMNNQMPGNYQPNMMMPNTQNYEVARLETELHELKRVVNELVKRVGRIENFLGIRGENYSEFDKLY